MKECLGKYKLLLIALAVLVSLATFGCSKTSPAFPSYEYGTVIQFGKGGNAEKYQAKGWSIPEDGFTWTDGKSASLQMSIKAPKVDVVMKATFRPFLVPGKLEKQKVVVTVNGNKAGEWEASADGEYKIIIPKDSLKKESMLVSFELPNIGSPSSVGVYKDDRLLGIAMKSLMLSEPSSYEYGTVIQFGKGGNAEKYQAKGWSIPEDGFTWTDGKSASLQMSIKAPKADVVMKATFRPFLVPGKLEKQKVVVTVNGNKAGEWEASADGEYKIIIPKDSLKKESMLVSFELPNIGSPSSVGVYKDDRLLGISLNRLSFSEGN